ncbi:hypothetical protein LZ023_32045 [Pseudomonas silvicola]|nr:hypothetical protein LZ023_32045 [Pseudomonas silvicola]
MVDNTQQRFPKAGEQDPQFDSSAALHGLAGFELHGVARSPDDSGLLFALSRGDDYAVARLHADGSPDTDFAGGSVIDAYGPGAGTGIKPGRRVAALGDKVIVGGMSEFAPGQYSPSLACYSSDGQRFKGFNETGQLVLAHALQATPRTMGHISFETSLPLCSSSGTGSASGHFPHSKAQQDFSQVNFDLRSANGKLYLIATGRIDDQPRLSGLVFCITADGQLDSTFGDNGVTALASETYSILLRSVALSNQWIYVGGGVTGLNNPAMAARIGYDGVQDHNWGQAGNEGYALTRQSFRINDLVVAPSGHLFGVGVGTTMRAIAVRLEADGSQDMDFGQGGAFVPGLLYSALTYAAIDAAGKLVYIGEYVDDKHGYLQAFVGRLHPNGGPDHGFGELGMARPNVFDSIGASLVLQTDGNIVAVGYTDRQAMPFAVRLMG